MPINASIEFDQAKEKYDNAETSSEKLAALQEMRSTAPSHKGAEHLRAEISGKISKLKKEMEKQKIQAKKSSGHSINIKKEKNAIGPVNCIKLRLKTPVLINC